MNDKTPTADQNQSQHYGNADSALLAGSATADPGAAARYERGEIDIYTLVSLIPEERIPPSLHLAYSTAKQVIDAPQFRAIADERRREQRVRDFLNQLEVWRLQRGESYVAAYEKFERTGKAIDAGQSVFESDWFRQLQEQRAREIAVLDEKERAGRLTPEEIDRRIALKRAHEGDKQVSEDWKSLAGDYQKIKARENTGRMTEDELREKEAQLKQRLFDQLDKASPELREQLLAQLATADPAFRREYEDRLRASAAKQNVASNLELLAEVRAIPEFADALIEDVVILDRPSSAAKTHGIDGVKTDVAMSGAFATAAVERAPAPDISEGIKPDTTRTGKHLTSDLA